MRIERLELLNFRNYRSQTVEFDSGVNVIVGMNAQGKTNLLEAINYIAALRSFRTNHERETINFGADFAVIGGEVTSGGIKSKIEIKIDGSQRRQTTLNGKRERNPAEVAGRLKTVVFSPDDLYIVKSSAAERRRFIDNAVCQLRPRYVLALSEYNKLLEHKRGIIRAGYGASHDLIEVYNLRLCEVGAVLVRHRASFLRRLEAEARGIQSAISDGKEELSLRYNTSKTITDPEARGVQVARELFEHMSAHREAELRSGRCLSGPHRDDFSIEINKIPARAFSSQGQIRSAALALKIGERNVHLRDTGELPALLLDDVLSELDDMRRGFLIKSAGEGQVFITSCDSDLRIVSQKKIIVNAGKLEL